MKTPEAELQLYEKEYEWLVSIRDQWHTSLKSINDQAGVSWGDWKTLLDNHPETNGSLHEFYRQLEELVTSIEEDADTKIGRASCRERVEMEGVAEAVRIEGTG